MKRGKLLNAPLSALVAQMGHTDEITVCDAGLPIPAGPERIDLALTSEAAFIAEANKGRPVEVVMTLPAALYAMICNTAVPDETISALQHALDGLILNGTQDRIYQHYGMPAQHLSDLVKKMD